MHSAHLFRHLLLYQNIHCSRILWLSSEYASLGYTIDFTSISMHAISTDPESFDKPCIYIQLDLEESAEDIYQNEATEENEDNDDILPELRLIPTSSSSFQVLESLFDALCKGAERNPDHELEEEGQGTLFFNQEEALAAAFQPDIIEHDDDEVDNDEMARFEDAENEKE